MSKGFKEYLLEQKERKYEEANTQGNEEVDTLDSEDVTLAVELEKE